MLMILNDSKINDVYYRNITYLITSVICLCSPVIVCLFNYTQLHC